MTDITVNASAADALVSFSNTSIGHEIFFLGTIAAGLAFLFYLVKGWKQNKAKVIAFLVVACFLQTPALFGDLFGAAGGVVKDGVSGVTQVQHAANGGAADSGTGSTSAPATGSGG